MDIRPLLAIRDQIKGMVAETGVSGDRIRCGYCSSFVTVRLGRRSGVWLGFHANNSQCQLNNQTIRGESEEDVKRQFRTLDTTIKA